MIDLLKTYKELKNAPGYVGSIRYYLAKKKLDVLFEEVDFVCEISQLSSRIGGKTVRKGIKRRTQSFRVH